MPSTTVLITTAAGLLLLFGIYQLWNRRNRAYHSSESVAAAYDAWTEDQLLESLWGEHVHLGHYGSPAQPRDFRQAKADFVHELVRWSGFDQLPPGSRVLDVGCGIGGSARILSRDYGLDVLGISIGQNPKLNRVCTRLKITACAGTARFVPMSRLSSPKSQPLNSSSSISPTPKQRSRALISLAALKSPSHCPH